jgi:hypothetical protein
MEMKLVRTTLNDQCTIGELFLDGSDERECFTLEDVVRPLKIPGMTAIPAGFYEVVVTFSARFKRPLPLLLNVPNFDGVRIHTGNTDKDTEGCILVGQTKGDNKIGQSRDAFAALFGKINDAAQSEKIILEITE